MLDAEVDQSHRLFGMVVLGFLHQSCHARDRGVLQDETDEAPADVESCVLRHSEDVICGACRSRSQQSI
ncbi:hypothetical protein B1H19_28700 [Streptomyces gilvosporeus]|uniref:Uncharacterized protein n=1 Tax=Streptomyces gilvosporeus TaxID=553510 RepID=A0A1V0TXK4_9ACTN|nr:hypothetical protein B1H19_28700 [Streptomyces gilvosporeus]